MRSAFLGLGAFAACAVEMVEALTIVLAVGLTRGWRPVRLGVAAGFLLLAFGMQWLRKAVLRASGHLPLHDEEMVFERELAASRNEPRAAGERTDWYAFMLSFKGVFLEGLEVALIVVTFGAAH